MPLRDRHIATGDANLRRAAVIIALAAVAAVPLPAPADGAVRRDLYSDLYAWHRVDGEVRSSDAVPTLRLRALWQPWSGTPLELYAFAQATRELGTGGIALGRIHADNRAITGAGALVTTWGRRAGLFVQGGPALKLVDDRRRTLVLDVRGGAFVGLETRGCAPYGRRGLVLVPCGEVYGEAVYLSRFDHDVVGFARSRAGATWLVSGPVAWQLLAEARGAADRVGDFYDNYADAGVAHRWRLLRPTRVDLVLVASAGRYRGVHAVDPAPARLGYADVRVEAATYFEF